MRAVIFDMDGVLVDSGAAHKKSWQAFGLEVGRPISDEEFSKGFGRSSRDIFTMLFGELADAQMKTWDDRKESLYRELIKDAIPLMPGARELVDALAAAHFRLAIGSSGPIENIELIVAALGTPSKFSAVVSGFDVTRGKPDPQVFQLAASKLGVDAKSCVVIEDAPAGIEAARRAGMRAIALTSSHARSALTAADRIVDSLFELAPDRL